MLIPPALEDSGLSSQWVIFTMDRNKKWVPKGIGTDVFNLFINYINFGQSGEVAKFAYYIKLVRVVKTKTDRKELQNDHLENVNGQHNSICDSKQ